jgi:hypothetical protein
VGEARWKEHLSKQDGWIGSKAMEAFALLVLVSNSKAWLCEEKKTHQSNRLTKHDCAPSCGKPSRGDGGFQKTLRQRRKMRKMASTWLGTRPVGMSWRNWAMRRETMRSHRKGRVHMNCKADSRLSNFNSMIACLSQRCIDKH